MNCRTGGGSFPTSVKLSFTVCSLATASVRPLRTYRHSRPVQLYSAVFCGAICCSANMPTAGRGGSTCYWGIGQPLVRAVDMLLLWAEQLPHHLFQRLLFALCLARQLGASMPKASNVLLRLRLPVR